MKRKNFFAMMAMAVILLSGCSPFSKMTKPSEMFIAPLIKNQESVNITNFALSPRLDIADSMMLVDMGIKTPSFAWKVIIMQKKENGWEFVQGIGIRAVNNEKLCLLIKAPGGHKYGPDDPIAPVDHSGTRFYNQQGEFIVVKDWRKVNPDDYKDFWTRVKDANLVEVKAGTPAWDELVEITKKFEEIEISQVKDFIYHKYNIPVGSPLSAEVLKRIENDPKIKKLKNKLGNNWHLVFSLPLNWHASATYIAIHKVIDVSSLLWDEDTNRPGYMDRSVTAADVFDMADYMLKSWGHIYIAPWVEEMLKNR